jgi:hypothetical protein
LSLDRWEPIGRLSTAGRNYPMPEEAGSERECQSRRGGQCPGNATGPRPLANLRPEGQFQALFHAWRSLPEFVGSGENVERYGERTSALQPPEATGATLSMRQSLLAHGFFDPARLVDILNNRLEGLAIHRNPLP